MLAAVLLAAGMALAVAGSARAEVEVRNALVKITEAELAGEIDGETALMYRVFALVAPARLPVRYAGDPGAFVKCGTEVILEARERRPTLSPGNQELLSQLLARPSTQTYIDTAHFRIHYDTSGANMIYGWPDATYRDAVMASVESCYVVQHGPVLDFDIPPSDGSAGGGTNLIDCYVQNLGSGLYGVTYSESEVPGTPENDRTAYFWIDNDYEGFGYADRADPARVTIAHEYNHVVQLGYDAAEGTWAMESGATWTEDEVYDTIDDNRQYISSFFTTYYKTLTYIGADGMRAYGSWIWNRYLSENFGSGIVSSIWTRGMAPATPYMNALQAELTSRGTSLDAEFEIFTIWNFLSGNRYAPGHYEEGDSWPTILASRTHTTYPVSASQPISPERLACNYIGFVGTGTKDTLSLGFAGSSCMAVRVITKDTTGAYDDSRVMALVGGAGSLKIGDWKLYERSFMVPVTHNSCPASGNTFNYTADELVATEVATLGERSPDASWLAAASPNPFRPETRVRFRLAKEGEARLGVYDPAGRLVRTLLAKTLPAGEAEVIWDGRDEGGQRASSGIYFYRLETPGFSQTRKVILAE